MTITAAEQREFLDQCVNSVQPITYTDRFNRTHLVNIASGNEMQVKNSKGKDETVITLLMIEAQPETLESGATGARAQEQFLLNMLNNVTPQEYVSDKWGKKRVFLMQLEKRSARSRKDTASMEWSYVLAMVDAWGGIYLYEPPALKITVTKTITLQTHVTDTIGSGKIGFAQIGV